MPATLIQRIAFSIAAMRLSGVPPSATALYFAALHRATTARSLVGFTVTIADAPGRSRASALKVIARLRAGVGLRPCGVVVALL